MQLHTSTSYYMQLCLLKEVWKSTLRQYGQMEKQRWEGVREEKSRREKIGALLEVQMLKKCTLFWRETHVEVKSAKREGFGARLDFQMSVCLAGARDSEPCQKWAKREGPVAISTTTTTLHSTILHYINLQLQLQLPLHYSPLSTLHYITLHYTTLPSTTLHSFTLHCTNYKQLQLQLHYTPH